MSSTDRKLSAAQPSPPAPLFADRHQRPAPGTPPPRLEAVEREVHEHALWVEAVRHEIARVIVGQSGLVDRLLVALLAGGHVLLEGVPGLAKTLSLKTLDRRHRGNLPEDPVHSRHAPGGHRRHARSTARSGAPSKPSEDPIFANLILADEINRAPAKVQSALLEAMQERQVTLGDQTHALAVAVPGHGDAEPDRAGGDLPVAGGPGRSLPAQGQRRVSDAATRSC